MKIKMKICAYFVRHGTTKLNESNCFRGPLNVDLDDKGKKQAEQLARYFKNTNFSAAYHSSKKRTKDTLEPIIKGKKIKGKLVKDFDALNVGDFAGQPKNEENVQKIKYYQEHPEEKIPGGERLNDFRKRTDPKIMMAIKRGDEAGEPTISAVHSSTIHEVSHLLHKDHQKVKVRPGGVVGVFKDKNGNYVAKALLKKSRNQSDQNIGT
jgi:broad specificity phosphatase PhoE